MTHKFEEICLSVGIDINKLSMMELNIHEDNLLLLADAEYLLPFRTFKIRKGDFPKTDQNGIAIAMAYHNDNFQRQTVILQPLHRIIQNKLNIIEIEDDD